MLGKCRRTFHEYTWRNIPFFYLAHAGWAKPTVYLVQVMQGVSYTQPADSEISILSEGLVSEFCIRQIAEFYEERISLCLLGKALQKFGKDLFFAKDSAEVFAYTIYHAYLDKSRWRKTLASAQGTQQLAYYLPVHRSGDEQGSISGRGFIRAKQLGGVEGVRARQGRDGASLAVCSEFQHSIVYRYRT